MLVSTAQQNESAVYVYMANIHIYTYIYINIYIYIYTHINICSAKFYQSCLTLCNPMDCSPPGSSVHEILQARILKWVAVSSSRDLFDPGIELTSLMSP